MAQLAREGSLEAGSISELSRWRSFFDVLQHDRNGHGRTEGEFHEFRKAAAEAKRRFGEADFTSALNLLERHRAYALSPMLPNLIWLCEHLVHKQTTAIAELNKVRMSEPESVRNFLKQVLLRGFRSWALGVDVATILPVVLDYESALWKAGISDISFTTSKRECQAYLDDLWAPEHEFRLSDLTPLLALAAVPLFLLVSFVLLGGLISVLEAIGL